jgi:NIMA (never in mitosis gene a)-related kinase 2
LVWKEINFEKMTSREKQQLVTEVNLLKGLDHPNIVRYEDRIVDKKSTKVFIIMEHCSGGDLGSFLKESKQKLKPLSEDIIWKIAYQLLLALEYCHNRATDDKGRGGKVLHRDIKPANIFINNSNYIKLGDFGLSREMG